MARRPGQRATRYGAKRLRLLRTWATLLMLAEPGPAPTARELLDRMSRRYPFQGLELSLQTTRDDLRLLREIDFPVQAIDTDGNPIDLDAFESLTGKLKNVRWRLGDPDRLRETYADGLPRPSAADVLTLDLLRSLLGQSTPPGFWLAATARRILDEVCNLQDRRTETTPRPGRERIVLEANAKSAAVLRSVVSPGTRHTFEDVDGAVRVTFDDRIDQAFEESLLTQADTITVISPRWLRRKLLDRLQVAVERHIDVERRKEV